MASPIKNYSSSTYFDSLIKQRIKEGLVVSFDYDGGSDSETRYVFVSEANYDRLCGHDFRRGAFRNFTRSKISNLHLLNISEGEYSRLKLDNIPVSGDVVVEGYEEDGRCAYYNTGLDIVFSIALPTPKVQEISAEGSVLTITNGSNSIQFYVNIWNKPKVVTTIDGLTAYHTTYEQFKTHIKQVLEI